METITQRAKRPALSEMGDQILAQYERQLHTEEDLTAVTIRNYLSGLRHFASWCEITWKGGREEDPAFTPERVATPHYRLSDLFAIDAAPQAELNQSKPDQSQAILCMAPLYRTDQVRSGKGGQAGRGEVSAPRHLDDQEEQALVAVVMKTGSLRDCGIIVLIFYTRLRAQELCTLTRVQVKLGKRSGTLSICGKHNKYREIPLNATARAALLVYDPSQQKNHLTTPLRGFFLK